MPRSMPRRLENVDFTVLVVGLEPKFNDSRKTLILSHSLTNPGFISILHGNIVPYIKLNYVVLVKSMPRSMTRKQKIRTVLRLFFLFKHILYPVYCGHIIAMLLIPYFYHFFRWLIVLSYFVDRIQRHIV